MSTSFWLDRTPEQKTRAFDVIIVGAGVSGYSMAYWLNKEDPALKVAILEKNRMSFGATGRNAGFITCGSVEHFNRLVDTHGEAQATEIWNFSETNLELLKSEIIGDEADEIEFAQAGSFSLASTEKEFAELKKTADLMRKQKIAVEVLDEKNIKDRLGAMGFAGGIKYVSDASVNPVKLVKKMASKSKATLFEQTEVIEVITGGDSSVRVVRTDHGDFEASMVLYAGNGYLPILDPYFKDKVFATRGQILVTEPVPPFMEGPCYANFVLDYFRQLPGGQMLIGGFRQLEKDSEVGYSDHTSEVIQAALYDFIQKHLPTLKDKKVTHRWAGIMGFSVDGQPMIGSLPNDQQVFFAGGYTAHGLGLAFHCAKQLIDLIFGKPIPNWLSARRL